ncbi:LAMI_0B03466g1_1 [Lachancea mirantina]|uniref:LAMI_0B03466g1_1 n=1 Tax=Lachancea mirantina TaxID=1230905 RepID=A0A1G4IUV3_9SACH|nr:LAMI_0B03466g1_1 [Lachancea mirantina]
MQFAFLPFFVFSIFAASAQAFRFGWSNITCKGLHGPHCGTYLLKVKNETNLYLGQSYFVPADVLAEGPSAAWGRFLSEEYRFLPRFTTIQPINSTGNFQPLIGTTNSECNFQSIDNAVVPYVNKVTNELSYDAFAYTSLNSTAATGVASQLLNASMWGVQVASCSPGFITDLLNAPTVNIFNIEDELPFWCTPIELEPVCPPSAGIV